MVRVIVYCEGLTEEIFVNEVLAPYFVNKGVCLYASQCGRGGVSKYSIIKKDITRWCRQDKNWYVTTMIDYYGFPSDYPWDDNGDDLENKICCFEKNMYDDLKEINFIPNLIVHEFEALLFSNVNAFSTIVNNRQIIEELSLIRDEFETPEHINNSIETSPSHRIKKVIHNYSKPIEGRIVAKEIGINKMRKECRHFDKWLNRLEQL